MSTVAQSPRLWTAEEFANRPDPGYLEELVKGRIVAMPPPGLRHGYICLTVGSILRAFVDDHNLGRCFSNDAGTITERDPDSVRGPDLCFYSFERLPSELLPVGYAEAPPDLVVEVLSPHDRWPKVLVKVGEYLEAGVTVVVVLDPESSTVRLFRVDGSDVALGGSDELAIPDLLPEFRVQVARLFA